MQRKSPAGAPWSGRSEPLGEGHLRKPPEGRGLVRHGGRRKTGRFLGGSVQGGREKPPKAEKDKPAGLALAPTGASLPKGRAKRDPVRTQTVGDALVSRPELPKSFGQEAKRHQTENMPKK